VAFATKAAGGEAGEGIEHAEEVDGVGLNGLAEAAGAEVGNGFADHGDGEFMSGLEGGDAFVLAAKRRVSSWRRRATLPLLR
jgi:hypothetical protein